MTDTRPVPTCPVITLRWFARWSGMLSLTVFLFVTFIGLVVAWRWDGFGAAMGFAGLIGFNISAPVSLATAAVISVTGSFALPVAIFFSCWWRTELQIRLKDG